MAYSERAKELRRCTGTRKDGEPCRAYACWDDPRGLCAAHGRHHAGPLPEQYAPPKKAKYPPCGCAAYQWPHRPGGGLCEWPDVPEYRLTTPAGTKSDYNGDGGWFSLNRRLSAARMAKEQQEFFRGPAEPEEPDVEVRERSAPSLETLTRDEEIASILARIGFGEKPGDDAG